KSERDGQLRFRLGEAEVGALVAPVAERMAELDLLDDDSVSTLHTKASHWEALRTSPEVRGAKLVADAWCAAFVAPKAPGQPVITDEVRYQLAVDAEAVPAQVRERVEELAKEYGFFHWHLAFAQVFKEKGGFDVVLGNPPWEQLQLQEQEFFDARDPDIA